MMAKPQPARSVRAPSLTLAAGQNQQRAPVPETIVASELDTEAMRVKDSLNALGETIGRLGARAESVLADEPPTEVGADSVESQPRSPLGRRLRELAYHAEALNETLARITSRLAS